MRSVRGSIRSVGKGRWRVSVSAGYDPVTGKRLRRDKTIEGTKREAEELKSRFITELGETSSTAITTQHYLERIWLPHMLPPRVRKRTYDGYESKIRVHVVPYLGRVRIDALTPLVLDRWMASLQSAGVSAHTRLHAYRVLRTALRQAVKWRMITTNPLQAVTPPTPERHDSVVLTVEEARRLLAAVEGDLVEPAIALAIGCGMRRSEICGLKWEDVDLGNGTVFVRRGRHVVSGEVIEEPPKTARSHRAISLPGPIVEILKRHEAPDGYVVSDEDGAPMNPDVVSRRYTRIRDAAKLPAVPLRDLRHTHATIALESGADIVVVSRRLGHSTVTTTDRFYLRPGRAADELAADAIGELLAPSRAKGKGRHVTRLKASGE